MKILITGATGFIGLELLKTLPENVSEVRILTRDPARSDATLDRVLSPLRRKKTRTFAWDSARAVAPATALEGIDFVIHLAGENVASGRWSEEVKRRIYDSRKIGTANLVSSLNTLPTPPVLISMSAVGYYGNGGDTLLSETSPQGPGFLAEVCGVWEDEARKAKVSRLVIPRLGVVLGPDGGAMEKLLPVFRAGIGGRVGDGTQWMSWIHRDDVIGFFLHAISNPKIEGLYNLVAPDPVRNETFAKTLGQVLHRPALLPVPATALKILFGEMAEQTLLASQRVSSEKLESAGFRFQHPKLEGALRQIVTP